MNGNSRLHITSESFACNETIFILSLLLLILLMPTTSAAADSSFTVITNKGIYALDENVIIVGIVPSYSSDDYAILAKVIGPSGQDCVVQNILPSSDNSFVSRPIKLDGCGFGHYDVLAYYKDMAASSSFEVSRITQPDSRDELELRLLKGVILHAQGAVNLKIQTLIDAGYILPEDIAVSYSTGTSEASSALQAVDFDDLVQAKKHFVIEISDFRDLLDMLSEEHLALFEQTVSSNATSAQTLEGYSRVQGLYYRLEELSQKNQVDKKSEFAGVASLLVSSKQMIDDNDLDGAKEHLAQANDLLEGIRTDLFEFHSNTTSPAIASPANFDNVRVKFDHEAKNFTNLPYRIERRSITNLLNKTGSNN